MSAPIVSAHPHEADWIAAAVAAISQSLASALRASGSAALLVSGGSTPAPVYRALAAQPLDWAKVEVRLVDERWLPVDDRNSNSRLIRESLLVDRASVANFESMLLPERNFMESVEAAERMALPGTVAMLGMGPDGHTASLFPDMRDLDLALSSRHSYIGIDANGCVGAGPWPRRITMTPHGLANCAARVLLIRGEQKLEMLQRAMEGSNARELPIRSILALPGSPLSVFWCGES